MSEILTTGFGPFGPHSSNASWDALALARPALASGVSWRRQRLDVAWDRAAEQLLGAITPATRWVLAFGLAEDDALRIERIAANAALHATPDIDGRHYDQERIIAEGPRAYEAALPWCELLEKLDAAGLPARESHDAGGYLCNFVFYHLMHHAAQARGELVAGFVHVPPAERLDPMRTAQAVALIIETVARPGA